MHRRSFFIEKLPVKKFRFHPGDDLPGVGVLEVIGDGNKQVTPVFGGEDGAVFIIRRQKEFWEGTAGGA